MDCLNNECGMYSECVGMEFDRATCGAYKPLIANKEPVAEVPCSAGLVCDVIDEFINDIPSHVNDMPAFSSNGVTRNEMEWKHLTFLMAKEIIKLRKAN